MNCALCGTAAVRDDQRFCARCGSELPPAAAAHDAEPTVQSGLPPVPPAGPPPAPWAGPPPAYSPPAPVSGPLFADDAPTVRPAPAGPPPPLPVVPPTTPVPPRRRGPLLVLLVAAVLAALVGAAGVVLLLGDDDGDGSTAATDEPARDRGTTPSDGSDGSGEASPSADEPSPTETPEPPTFRCWSGGAPVTDLADCGVPSGVDGLTWVFPSADDEGCFSESSVQRASEIDCSPGGVRFHYSEWRSRAALERYYGGNTLTEIGAPGGRGDLSAFEVVSRDPDVGYKVAIYYADPSAVWSVTIYAADRSQYLSAVSGLDVRAFRDLRGTKA